MNSRTRDGRLVSTYDGQGSAVRFLYRNPLGQQLTKLLICPWVSKSAGWFLSRGLSRVLIGGFVRKNGLDLSEYPEKRYRSFNDFFTREILPEKRPIDRAEDHLIAPSDGKLTAYQIAENGHFPVKGVEYTLPELLRDEALAERYRGGWLLLFRLSVDDYHRYCYVSSGVQSQHTRLPGVFHTVNPLAAASRPIYRENTREYVLLETATFGTVLQMEVGALLVGRIRNHLTSGPVRRGQEKGWFEFGGSTVILLLEKDRVQIDRDILKNSRAGEETLVKMGEKIGRKNADFTERPGTAL